MQKREGGAGFRNFLAGRIQPASKELDVLWYGVFAAAVVKGHVVDAVRVENSKVGVAGFSVGTRRSGVVQLDAQAKNLEGCLGEVMAVPFLFINKSKADLDG